MPALHVVVPVYNERDTLEPCLRRLALAPLPAGFTRSLYLVDDHSEPAAHAAAQDAAKSLAAEGVDVSWFRHQQNLGKGAALRTGFDAILGSGAPDDDVVAIQDADLEYDPADLTALLGPIIAGETRVAMGTRWGAHQPLRGTRRRLHAAANRALTMLSNLMTGYRLSDVECCYKLMTAAVLRRLRPMLTESRFGIEPQIVAGLARLGERIVERPIRYRPRDAGAGKKIGWRDGARAVYVIVRERLRRAPHDARVGGADRAGAPGTERTR